MDRTVLLAFSGGLDTSYCVLRLRSQGWQVRTATVDTGGFAPGERQRIRQLALDLGAVEHDTVDARRELFEGTLRHLVAGNVLRGGLYPLCVSAERVCQARKLVELARQHGVDALAHGSTGAGNDQVRFDGVFRTLAPELPCLAPIRELSPSRAEEQAFLAREGFVFPERMEAYSYNEGMWGTSIGGRETHDSWASLPEEAWPGGRVDPALPPRELVLGFQGGRPRAMDGNPMEPVTLIQALNALGRTYGIGRGIHLGDTILGIKGRVAFEAPAAHLLIAAHRELEKLVLTGLQLFWKDHLGSLYGTLLHEARFLDPLARDLEAFLDSSQSRVEGEVRLSLRPHAFSVEGVRSPHGLMDSGLAAYGEASRLWSAADAAGFCRIQPVSQILAHRAAGLP